MEAAVFLSLPLWPSIAQPARLGAYLRRAVQFAVPYRQRSRFDGAV